jgi:hypothetical protein
MDGGGGGGAGNTNAKCEIWTRFWSENLKGKDHSEDLHVVWEGNTMELSEVVDWMNLAKDTEQWRPFGFHKMRGISWLSDC